jgi:predicted TIM-barrel fold metal-dependent hydrolase
MRIIDAHAHIYPAKIAEKATQAISDFYEIPMRYHGSIAELIASGDRIGVERYVVHSTATKAGQVTSINDFIIGEVTREKRFIGFGTLHPDYEGFEEEIARVRNAGLRGIKLHPDFQKFEIDTPKMDPLYAALADAGIPVLVHAGDRRYDFSGPRRIAKVLDKQPGLKMIAAHFGGYTEWDESFDILAGRDLWFDTSSTLFSLSVDRARSMIEKHGADKFLFGSDFPMWDHEEELARFMALGLSQKDNEAILAGNAARLLGV